MSKPFRKLTAKTRVLDQSNVDTDQIIPARFLTATTREGFGEHAFHDRRWNADGTEKADSPLPSSGPGEATILVAGKNFGCGSSREHAAWALSDYGFKAVISSGLADIFRANALKNGLLAIDAPEEVYERLLTQPDIPVTIDLDAKTIAVGNDAPVAFEIEPFARTCLLEGVDQLGYLLAREDSIAAFEAERT
ncbi:MAG: 3-isopropylmalate dehydratase small subunit [Maricaulaceae bacterium]|jgi:3-isopropylmalate/(R)-2-methylmalate dehydratase small subunit